MTTKLQPQWIVGFVDGKGCFRASLIKNSSMKFKTQIQIEFVITQYNCDVALLYALKSYFQCGQVSIQKNDQTNNCYRFRVRKLEDLLYKVIPFFEKHPLKTKKNIEFKRFRKLCFLLNEKTHHILEGFQKCHDLAKSIPFSENLEK